MSQSATDRYRLRPAPAGLALVQDFLNTRAIGRDGTDLLADRGTAEAWLERAVARWAADRDTQAPHLTLSATDLRALRTLRTTVQQAVGGTLEPGPAMPATLQVGAGGEIRLLPEGRGWRWLASVLWIETYRAQQDGTWARLKVCRNPVCASAFYDVSRNNSGTWHDVRTCGNMANLRASRERKREREHRQEA